MNLHYVFKNENLIEDEGQKCGERLTLHLSWL